jgi:predicted DNA-binding transcriptional regulator
MADVVQTEEVLIDLGLSRNESRVYLALLELGSPTATEISKKSKVERTNVYDALQRLINKGIISVLEEGDKRKYIAGNPELLLSFLKETELKFTQILPQLQLKRDMSGNPDHSSVFPGITGIKHITDDILISCNEGDKIFTWGVPKNVPEIMKSFLGLYHKRRIMKKIWMYHLYNQDAAERIRYLNHMPYTKALSLGKKFDVPATTTVYRHKVAFFIWEPDPLGILVESESLYKSFNTYAEMLWANAAHARS